MKPVSPLYQTQIQAQEMYNFSEKHRCKNPVSKKKVLNKIFTNYVQEHTKKIIHNKEVGFMPVQVWFNMYKSTSAIWHTNKHKDRYHRITLIEIFKGPLTSLNTSS